MIRNYPQDADAYAIRGHAMLLSMEFESASSMFRECLRLDPDHKKAKLLLKRSKQVQNLWNKEILHAFTYRNFQQCIDLCNDLLALFKESGDIPLPNRCSLYIHIESKKSTCYLRLKRYQECLKCCANILYLCDDCEEAWLSRLSCLRQLGRYDEALSDCKTLMQSWGSNNVMIKHEYEKAEFEVI